MHETDMATGKNIMYMQQTLKIINGITRALPALMEWKCQALK